MGRYRQPGEPYLLINVGVYLDCVLAPTFGDEAPSEAA